MAQTKKKRRRKRRGTQSGRIDSRGRRGRPRSRAEARAQARRRAQDKRATRTPTWGSAITRGVIGALIFLVLLMLLFGYPFAGALGLSAIMLALYIPLGYYMDRFFWRRRQRMAQRGGQAGG